MNSGDKWKSSEHAGSYRIIRDINMGQGNQIVTDILETVHKHNSQLAKPLSFLVRTAAAGTKRNIYGNSRNNEIKKNNNTPEAWFHTFFQGRERLLFLNCSWPSEGMIQDEWWNCLSEHAGNYMYLVMIFSRIVMRGNKNFKTPQRPACAKAKTNSKV